MSTSFRLLDSNYRMQQRPFGTNTALSNGTQNGAGGSFGSALRRQESGYGRALRILDRQARRGDANSALRAIDVRNQAMEQGMSPGILRNVDEKRGDVYGRMGAMERNRADSEMVRDLALQQAREELGVGTLNPKDMQLGSTGMVGNGTKVAQNGTSVQNTSRNVTTDTMGNTTIPRTAVQGASGVQGATRVQGASGVQGSQSLGSRLTSGWDRFKAGVTGAVDAVTGKIPDVEPPKAQEPVGKIDGRPAQEVLKEMRDRRERELGELPQYAPPKAIVVPEPRAAVSTPAIVGPPASAAPFPGPAGPPASAAPFPGPAGPPSSAAPFPGPAGPPESAMRSRSLDRTRVTPQNPPVEEPVTSEARLNARNKASALAFSNMERPKEAPEAAGPPASAAPAPEIAGPPESARGSRILSRPSIGSLNKSSALAFSNMARPKVTPPEMTGPPESAKPAPTKETPKVTGVGEMIEDTASAAGKKLAESASSAGKWLTSGAGKPEGFRKVTQSDIAKGEANDAAWRQYRDMVKRQGNTPTYEGFAAWKRSQK